MVRTHGSRVLCLASGGGQQGPLLAAAGLVITGFYEDKGAGELDGYTDLYITTLSMKPAD